MISGTEYDVAYVPSLTIHGSFGPSGRAPLRVLTYNIDS